MCLSSWANTQEASFSEILLDKNQQEQNVAVSHFQHNLFIEENLLSYSSETPSDVSIFGTANHQKSFTKKLSLAKYTSSFLGFLPDKRSLILYQLFLYFFFF